MSARKLVPEQHQCEAMRAERYLSDTPKTDMRCQLSASYEFNGKKLCARHAGIYALRAAVADSESSK